MVAGSSAPAYRMARMPWIEVRELAIAFPRPGAWSRVVDGVTFALEEHGSLGIVGPSGSGKSLSLVSLLGLLPPGGRKVAGSVQVGGVEVFEADASTLQALRGGVVGLVFQAPGAAFNPVLSVGRQVAEGALLHGKTWPEARLQALALLEEVGLVPPEAFFRAFPHELSGGQLQRALFAAALAGNPRGVVLDEPTSALDPLAQNAFLALLERARHQRRLATVLASHDLQLVAAACQELAVLAEGETVELGAAREVLLEPLHPATRALCQSAEASLPRMPRQPSGCRLVHNCPWAMARCAQHRPALAQVGEGRWVRCFLHHQEAADG
jgi:peptide/nickel transport system ATP-binding protein